MEPSSEGGKLTEDEQVRQIASALRVRDLFDKGFRYGISKNSFHLILKAIMLNPHNTLLWETRRWLLQAYGRSRKLELEYLREITKDGEAGAILRNCSEMWMAIIRTLDTNEKYKELEFMKNFFSQKHIHVRSKKCWDHRRNIAGSFPAELQTDVADMELQFSHEILLLNMKNRHAWLHRRWVFKNLGTINKEDEFKLTSDFVKMDVNNKFAWFHRKWLIKEFGGLEDELEFCNVILQIDSCCVSSWHQRAFVILECTSNLSDKMRVAEVKYAIRAIFRNPENELPWKYLKLLYMKCDYYDSIIDKACFSLLSRTTNVILDIKDKRSHFVNVLGTLLELLCRGYQPSHCMGDMIAELCSKAPGMIVSLGSEDSLCEFINSITSLLKYVDPMNDHFWESMKSEVNAIMQARLSI